MTKPIEEMLIRAMNDNNAVFIACYEAGYEAGKRDALRVLKEAVELAATLSHKTGESND